MQDFQVELIRSLERLRAFVPEWRGFLSGESVETGFYQDPDYVLLYLETYHAETTPLVLVLRQAGRIVAVAPFFVRRSRFRLRLSVITLASLNCRMLRLCGDRLQVVPRADYEVVLRAVCDTLAGLRGCFDVVHLEVLPLQGRLYQAFERRSDWPLRLVRLTPQPEVVRGVLVEGRFEDFLAGRSKNFRKNYRRRQRELYAAVGAVQIERICAVEQVAEFLDAIEEVYPKTWQARTFTPRQRNSADERRFYEQAARLGWLKSYVLRCDGRPVAFEIGFQYGGMFFCQESGYDQAWQGLAPGTVLVHSLVEDLFTHDQPRVVDFGYGENQYKRELCNTEYAVCAAYLVRSGLWRLLILAQRATNRFYRFTRAWLERTGLDVRMRSLLKHKSKAGNAAPKSNPEQD
jgi:CelD/BcsL family acetyltransferase involved in cellulose biosynthesis